MRKRVVEVMMAQKEGPLVMSRFGLQLFAGDESGDGADDGNDGGDGEGGSGSGGDADQDDGEKRYTDKEVNDLIERKFAEWQKKQEKQREKQDEAERLKNMTEQERKDHEMP